MRIYPILVWLLTAGIFALDVAAGKELNFWFIYLLPVCLQPAREAWVQGVYSLLPAPGCCSRRA